MWYKLHTHTHNGILVIKINEILSFAATWLDLEIIILGKVKKKNLYHLRVYLQNRKRLIDFENNLITKGGKVGEGINWEFGVNIYRLP